MFRMRKAGGADHGSRLARAVGGRIVCALQHHILVWLEWNLWAPAVVCAFTADVRTVVFSSQAGFNMV